MVPWNDSSVLFSLTAIDAGADSLSPWYEADAVPGLGVDSAPTDMISGDIWVSFAGCCNISGSGVRYARLRGAVPCWVSAGFLDDGADDFLQLLMDVMIQRFRVDMVRDDLNPEHRTPR